MTKIYRWYSKLIDKNEKKTEHLIKSRDKVVGVPNISPMIGVMLFILVVIAVALLAFLFTTFNLTIVQLVVSIVCFYCIEFIFNATKYFLS